MKTLLDLLLHYGLNPTKDSSTRFKLSCPFHEENTPSFVIYTDTDSAFCFGCSWAGDGMWFIKTKENITLQEAKQKWQEFSGGLLVEALEDQIESIKETIKPDLLQVKLITVMRQVLYSKILSLKRIQQIWRLYDDGYISPQKVEKLIKLLQRRLK